MLTPTFKSYVYIYRLLNAYFQSFYSSSSSHHMVGWSSFSSKIFKKDFLMKNSLYLYSLKLVFYGLDIWTVRLNIKSLLHTFFAWVL